MANWKRYCPDGGVCHHECDSSGCFRVDGCFPLSGVFPNDEWPQPFGPLRLYQFTRNDSCNCHPEITEHYVWAHNVAAAKNIVYMHCDDVGGGPWDIRVATPSVGFELFEEVVE